MAQEADKPAQAETPETAQGESPNRNHGDRSPAAEDAGGTLGGAGLSAEELIPGLEAAVAAEASAALEAKLAEIEAERDALKEKLMRALADGENARRRAERDRKDAETYGGTKLARDLLSVHDNLARAMEAADDGLRQSHGPFLEGIELTQRELLSAFSKHKIAPIAPEKGERFDPNRHQAMFEAPIPDAAPGTVIEVMQTGFVISDRLLRPALVGIAKAVDGAAEPAAGGEGGTGLGA
ncbi:MAG: nucleotide exchange factor GrpE, partial [Pikeienuella sp.]